VAARTLEFRAYFDQLSSANGAAGNSHIGTCTRVTHAIDKSRGLLGAKAAVGFLGFGLHAVGSCAKHVNETGKTELPLLKLSNRITISDEPMPVDTPARKRAPKFGQPINPMPIANRHLAITVSPFNRPFNRPVNRPVKAGNPTKTSHGGTVHIHASTSVFLKRPFHESSK
jgi:hypothetical protein